MSYNHTGYPEQQAFGMVSLILWILWCDMPKVQVSFSFLIAQFC